VDSWLASAKELRAYRSGEFENGKDKQSEAEREGYTYPPCNPEKRIDFVLVRNQSTEEAGTMSSWVSRIKSSWLTGQEVTEETGDPLFLSLPSLLSLYLSAHLLEETSPPREKAVGMLDHESPIWASDHYSVVTDLELLYLRTFADDHDGS
jgi:hypothetical protein